MSFLSKLSEAFPRSHHVVLVLGSASVTLTLYRQGFAFWKKVRDVELLFDQEIGELRDIEKRLQDEFRAWRVLGAVQSSWILPGNILNIAVPTALNPSSGTDLASMLPFPPVEVRTSLASRPAPGGAPVLWVHKDWVNEIARICNSLNWTCVELFSRAQLFQPLVARSKKRFKFVIERCGKDGNFHAYSESGEVCRTGLLPMQDPDLVMPQVEREVRAFSAIASENAVNELFEVRVGKGYAPLPSRESAPPMAVTQVDLASIVNAFFRSTAEGIVIAPDYGNLVHRINLFSVSVLLIGLGVLGGMFWHDRVLQRELIAARLELRKETPPYQAAQTFRNLTLKMADAVSVKRASMADPSVFKPLAEIMQVLPASTSLASFEARSGAITLHALGDAMGTKVALEKNASFADLKPILATESSSAGGLKAFGIEMKWRGDPGDAKQSVPAKGLQ